MDGYNRACTFRNYIYIYIYIYDLYGGNDDLPGCCPGNLE